MSGQYHTENSEKWKTSMAMSSKKLNLYNQFTKAWKLLYWFYWSGSNFMKCFSFQIKIQDMSFHLCSGGYGVHSVNDFFSEKMSETKQYQTPFYSHPHLQVRLKILPLLFFSLFHIRWFDTIPVFCIKDWKITKMIFLCNIFDI